MAYLYAKCNHCGRNHLLDNAKQMERAVCNYCFNRLSTDYSRKITVVCNHCGQGTEVALFGVNLSPVCEHCMRVMRNVTPLEIEFSDMFKSLPDMRI